MNPVRELERQSSFNLKTKALHGQSKGFSNGVRRFFISLLHSQVLTFLLLILVISGLIVYLFPASFKPSAQATVGEVSRCKTDKFSPDLRNSQISRGHTWKLLVSFKQQPTAEAVDGYKQQGISLYLDSWLLDYLVAESSYDKLCDLAQDKNVTYIDLLSS